MPRKRKSDIVDEQPAAIGHNGGMPPADIVQDFTHDIEKDYDRLDTLRGEYMNSCRQVRDSIARKLTEAADAGIPRRELKAVIKTRRLEGKIDKLRDELERDEVKTYDAIRQALGDFADLPLGAAALAKGGEQSAA